MNYIVVLLSKFLYLANAMRIKGPGASEFYGIYEDSRHLLQNQKLPRNIMGYKNHNLFHEFLKQ